MAYNESLSIPKTPPIWVTILSSGHEPFYFRYQEGERLGKKQTIVHGGQTPDLIPMAVELKQLIEMVGLAVQ